MDFGRFFRGPGNLPKRRTPNPPSTRNLLPLPDHYLQVVFVLGLATVIMVIGKVLVTPLWVFLFGFLMIAGGLIYIYRKQKSSFESSAKPSKPLTCRVETMKSASWEGS